MKFTRLQVNPKLYPNWYLYRLSVNFMGIRFSFTFEKH